jgi:type II secretory pathway component PulK
VIGAGRRVGGDERGIALVLVLLVLALLLTIVGEFALVMRLEGTTTLNFRAAVAAALLAEAGYHRAAIEIEPDAIAHHLEAGVLVFRRSRTEVAKAPDRQDVALGPGRFSYRLSDEESRLNLNRLSADQLQRLLLELGVEREARDTIVDSVLDWRDGNEEHRLNGAESDYYEALPVPYRSKNADFDSVDELLLVRGITPAIFYGTADRPGLAEQLTLTGTGQINVNTAGDLVLRTLGYATAEVDLLKQGRPYLELTGLPSGLRARGNLTVRSSAFRVEATGVVPGQGRRTLRAIAQRRPGPGGAGRVVALAWSWVDDRAARAARPPAEPE